MKYIIMGLFSLLAVTTQAQVRGIVKDNTGEPVPGANVFWVNTGRGCNYQGRWQLFYLQTFEESHAGNQFYRLSE